MRGIKIDVESKSIYEVDVPSEGTLDAMYKLLGCQTVDALSLFEKETLWLDDEGLLREPILGAFRLAGRAYAGHGLILGTDSEGDSVNATTSVAAVYALADFVDTSELPEPSFIFIPL